MRMSLARLVCVVGVFAFSVVAASPRLALAAPAPAAPAAKPAATQPALSAAPAAPASAAPAVAPVNVAAASAAAAQPVPVDNVAPPDSFDLTTALRGAGPAMTTDEVADRAVKTAPSIAKAEAAAEKARQAAAQVNLALYPRLDLTARYTRLSYATPLPVPINMDSLLPLDFTKLAAAGFIDPTKLQGKPFAFPDVIHDQLLGEATVAYPVSQIFFSILPRYRAAKQAIEVSKLQAVVEAQTVGVRAREAYWNYARGRASLVVARAALAQAEAHRRDVEALVAAGTLARVELMRADAQIATANVAVARTQGAVAVGRAALYSITHLEGTDDITILEDLQQPLPPLTETSDALLAKALERRSEIKALRTLAGVHQLNIDGQQGDKLPKFTVGGLADVANPNQRYSMYTAKWGTNWAAYAQLTWSPNDLLTAGKAADQTRADLAQTLADLESLEDALKIEIAQAYEDYGSSRQAMDSTLAGIAAAEESYRVRREQFRAGSAVATEVIDAESELRRARLDLVNASIDMRIARAKLDRATEAK